MKYATTAAILTTLVTTVAGAKWRCQVISGGEGPTGILDLMQGYEDHWGEGDIDIPSGETNEYICDGWSWSAVNIGGYEVTDKDSNREEAVRKAREEIGDGGEYCTWGDIRDGGGGLKYVFQPAKNDESSCGGAGGASQCNTQKC